MTYQPGIERHIREWLDRLAKVTRPGSEPVDAETIALTAGLLAKDGFPASAFTGDSAHHVLQGQRYFPAYEDVRAALRAWWNLHRPQHAPQLSGPEHGNLSVEDRLWVDHFHARRAEILTPGYIAKRGSVEGDLANLASLFQAQSPNGWAFLSGPAPAYSAPTQAEIDAIYAKYRMPGVLAAEANPEPAPRDVSLSGEALRLSRERRGIVTTGAAR